MNKDISQINTKRRTNSLRITHAEKELRVFQIYKLIIEGTPRHQLVKFGKEEWGACPRVIDTYISEVNTMLKNTLIDDYKHQLNLMNSRIEDLINRCYLNFDFKTIVNLMKLQSEILGVKSAEKIDVSINWKTKWPIDSNG